jgi:hypothetical protein
VFAYTGIRDFAALLLATALTWSQGGSNAAHADPNVGMREIYTLSDLSGQIQPVLGYAIEALVQQQTRFTAEQFEIATQVLREQFASEKLEKRVLEFLEKRAEGEYLDEALEWLRTPLAGRIMRANIATYSRVDSAEMMSFFAQKQANPPTQKRLELIERYDTAAFISAMASTTVLLSAYGAAAMADALKPEDERLGLEALLESMNSQRALLEPIFEETSAVTSRFTFRGFSDEEIEALVVFSESEAGKWYHRTTSSVFIDTLEKTTASLGDTFIVALLAQPPS